MRMPRIPWRLDPELLKRFAPGVWNPDEDLVELYYLPDDFSQASDLSASHPEKVKELQALFWEEAEKYNIKPLLAGFSPFFGIVPPLGTQTTTTYYGDVQNVAPGCVPRVYNHSYTISADLHIPDGGAEGVIVADANHLGGFSLFVQDGKLKHTYAFLGVFEYRQESEGELPTGDVNVQMAFVADEAKPATPGQVTLYVNGEQVGSGRMDHTVPFGFSGYSGLDVGRDNGLVVDRGYAAKAPFAFTGTGKKGGFDGAARVELVAGKQLTVEGVAMVTNDADGNVTTNETGDHLGRKGLEIGGGVGLVVGLLAPPLLASAVVGGAAGGLIGKFARHPDRKS